MARRRVTGAQNVSRMCHVCGTENPSGLHTAFYELESGELLGVFEPRDDQQGYPGRLHGGIAATLLDETIGRAVSIGDPNAWGVTVELTLRYKQPIPLDAPVKALGRIVKDSRRLFEGTGEIVLEDGTVAVEAHGRYLKMPIDKIAEGDFGEQWFPDTRELPDDIEV